MKLNSFSYLDVYDCLISICSQFVLSLPCGLPSLRFLIYNDFGRRLLASHRPPDLVLRCHQPIPSKYFLFSSTHSDF
jgi:hypothetical protein